MQFGQREVEGGALSFGAACPDFAVVAVDDAVGDAEADAGARVFAFFVESLERDEEFVSKGHVEADAVVLDEESGLV